MGSLRRADRAGTGSEPRGLRPLVVLAVAAVALSGASAARAYSYPDLRGDWTGGACVGGTLSACEANPQYPHTSTTTQENFNTGQISGTGFTGQITGCTLTVHGTEQVNGGTYTSDGVQTISADGNHLTGTFSDSYGQSGPVFDDRKSGGPTTCSTKTSPPPPCGSITGYSAVVMGNSPVAYYKLDEASGPTMCDSSNSGNHGGYASKGLTYGATGATPLDQTNPNNAATADGTGGGIGMSGAGTTIFGNHSFTLAGWYRWIPSAQHPQPQDQALVALAGPAGVQGPGSVAGLAVWNTASSTYNAGGPACAAHGTALVLDLYQGYNCWDTQALKVNVYDGAWHYLVVTYDSGTGTVAGYVDGGGLGQQVAHNPMQLNGLMNGVGPQVRIGSWVDTSVNQPVVGAEDEVAVYPVALNDSDVLLNWDAATVPQSQRTGAVASHTQVTCNLDVASGIDTCGAQVAGENQAYGGQTPTGTVTFSTVAGSDTRGRFAPSSCTLAPTEGSPGISYCSVKFQPDQTDTDFPHIHAAYGGDGHLLPSSADTAFLHACVAFPPSSPTREVLGQSLLARDTAASDGTTLPATTSNPPTPCEGLPVLPIGYLDPPTAPTSDLSVAYPEACPSGQSYVAGAACVPSRNSASDLTGARAGAAAKRKVRIHGGITIRYRLKGPAAVTFWIARVLPGRRGTHNRCVAQTRRNRRARSCTRLVLVRGHFTIDSHAGLNSFLLTGRMNRHKLAPGRYLLIARPELERSAGIPRTLRFRVVIPKNKR